MKHILISIKPKWVAKILNGEKTIEIRKSMPKCELPCKVYIYCSKGQELWGDGTGNTWHGIAEDEDLYRVFELTPNLAKLNGKVVAEFTLKKVGMLKYLSDISKCMPTWFELEKTCLTDKEIKNYLQGKTGYAWHIDDLEIYDKPKELAKFGLKRPPQSWCYVKESKYE